MHTPFAESESDLHQHRMHFGAASQLNQHNHLESSYEWILTDEKQECRRWKMQPRPVTHSWNTRLCALPKFKTYKYCFVYGNFFLFFFGPFSQNRTEKNRKITHLNQRTQPNCNATKVILFTVLSRSPRAQPLSFFYSYFCAGQAIVDAARTCDGDAAAAADRYSRICGCAPRPDRCGVYVYVLAIH